MRNFEKYEGCSLMKLMFDVKENNSIVVFAYIRGHWVQMAHGFRDTLVDVVGLHILDSAIIECKLDKHAKKWYVKIDIDREGKFE